MFPEGNNVADLDIIHVTVSSVRTGGRINWKRLHFIEERTEAQRVRGRPGPGSDLQTLRKFLWIPLASCLFHIRAAWAGDEALEVDPGGLPGRWA